jgi:Porin subfamily
MTPMILRTAALFACATLPTAALAGGKPDPRCVLYGEGFTWWESASSCIRISGEIRADTTAGPGSGGFGSQGQLKLDSRTATELGPLRIFVSPKVNGN